ncbi:hypothetical protein TWF730_003598 [Orbilia blumenaviensis]|uniref:Uncharacterized protein n=1 Tax=Orbilia blumenaviensis TaxID=1796055 RepID=A0AAV9U5A7_9PEZI
MRGKVRALGACVWYRDRIVPTRASQQTPVYVRSAKKLEPYVNDVSLNSLIVDLVQTDFGNFAPAWNICQRNYRTLKSLSILGVGSSRTPPNPNKLASILSGGRRLEALEEICFKDIDWYTTRSENPNFDLIDIIQNFGPVYVPGNIKKLSLLGCSQFSQLNRSWIRDMVNLTELDIRKRDTLSDLEGLLCNLTRGLSALWISWHSVRDKAPIPGKTAFKKHSTTLKKLWIHSEHPYNYGTWNELPFCVDEGSDELDLKTLSEFPVLQHLSVPVRIPESWTPWAPMFPSLKSLYWVNFLSALEPLGVPASTNSNHPDEEPEVKRDEIEIPSKLIDSVKDLLSWLASPYEGTNRDEVSSAGMNLQAVILAFRQQRNRNYSPWSWIYRAYVRDRSTPCGFETSPKMMEFIHYWYPEIWEFCKTGNRKAPLR